MFFYEKKDYQIENQNGWYRVSKPDSYQPGGRQYIARFPDADSAVRFITRFTEPRTITSTYYDVSCSCGYVKEGWDFVTTTDGIIFERCNKCLKPIYAQDLSRLNKKSMEDFDLDAFLNM